jgi:RNA-directed DNA polymerase
VERARKRRVKRRKVNLMRDADDCIVTGDSAALLRAAVTPVIATCLAGRGLPLSEEKTHIVHIEAGLDFLGQNIRTYHGKRLIQPAKQGVKTRLDTRRAIRTRHPMAKPATVIRQMNPVLRGGGKNGVCTGEEAQGQTIHLLKAAATPIQRHVTVQGHANPSEPAYEAYCEARLAKQWATGYDGHANITGLWQRQAGKCPSCGHPITPESRWHVHHTIPRVEGGPHTRAN